MKISSLKLIMILSLCIPLTAIAADVKSIIIIDYGIFKANVIKSSHSGTAAAGPSNLKNPAQIQQTDEIPALLGTRFGFHFFINGSPRNENVNLLFRVVSPPLKSPDEKEISSQEVLLKSKIGAKGYADYAFDDTWELVPGKWVLQLLYEGKVMAEKSFTINEQ